MRKFNLKDFLPSSRADALHRLYRGVYPLGLTLITSLSINSILSGAVMSPRPVTAFVKSQTGAGGGYVLSPRYDGLVALEKVDSATIILKHEFGDTRRTYEFDLFNRLAFEGENMYDVDERRISPALKSDYAAVASQFCARNKGHLPKEPYSRFTSICKAGKYEPSI